MQFMLTAPHYIEDRIWPRDTVFGPDNFPKGFAVTPLMIGLDDEAAHAVYMAKVRIFGRPNRWGVLLDDPPIERPIDDPQPTPVVGGQGGPG